MPEPTEALTNPQGDTGSGADSSNQGQPTAETKAGGDTTQPTDQESKAQDGAQGDATPPAGDAQASPGEVDGEKVPEGPKADVQNAAEYGLEGTDDLTKAFSEIAFQAGMTKAQVKAVSELWKGQLEAFAKANDTAKAEATALLMKDWGDNFKANLALAGKTLDQLGTPSLKAKLNKTGFGNDPDLVKVFHHIGKMLSEDALILSASGKGTNNDRTPGGQPLFGFKEMPGT